MAETAIFVCHSVDVKSKASPRSIRLLTESLFWQNGDRTTLCIVKNPTRRATINNFGAKDSDLGDKAFSLRLLFTDPIHDLINERTGAKLGDGTAFDDPFTPWEANVYTYRAK